MEKLNREFYEYQINPTYFQGKLTKLKDRSRRDNVRIDVLKQTKGETWNDREEKVHDMFVQKLGLDGSETGRAHQVKRNNIDSNTNRARTIIVNLLRYKDKTKIPAN